MVHLFQLHRHHSRVQRGGSSVIGYDRLRFYSLPIHWPVFEVSTTGRFSGVHRGALLMHRKDILDIPVLDCIGPVREGDVSVQCGLLR